MASNNDVVEARSGVLIKLRGNWLGDRGLWGQSNSAHLNPFTTGSQDCQRMAGERHNIEAQRVRLKHVGNVCGSCDPIKFQY